MLLNNTRELDFPVDNHDTGVNLKSSYFTLKQFSEKHRSLSLRDLSCLHLNIVPANILTHFVHFSSNSMWNIQSLTLIGLSET